LFNFTRASNKLATKADAARYHEIKHVFYKEEYHDLTERMRTLKVELARERKKEMRFKIVESVLAYIFSVVAGA